MIAKSWCSSVTHFSPSSLPSPWKLLFVFPIFVAAYWTRVPARDSDEPLVEPNASGWNFLTIPKWAYSSSFILKQMDQCQTNRVSDRTLARKGEEIRVFCSGACLSRKWIGCWTEQVLCCLRSLLLCFCKLPLCSCASACGLDFLLLRWQVSM